jgi:hypothetical protein
MGYHRLTLSGVPSRFPRTRTLVVCLAALIVFAASTQAKVGQYHPHDSGTKFLAQAVKMNTAPVHHGVTLPVAASAMFVAPVLVEKVRLIVPEVLFAQDPLFLIPFESRPPPFTSR